MNDKIIRIRNIVFWLLVAIFAALVAIVFTGLGKRWGPELPSSAILYLAVFFFLLAVVLTGLTVWVRELRIRKTFFIITGASAAAIIICGILHNLVYVLFFHGKGGDEPVFFVLTIFVFPALFVFGAVASIVLPISSWLRDKES